MPRRLTPEQREERRKEEIRKQLFREHQKFEREELRRKMHQELLNLRARRKLEKLADKATETFEQLIPDNAPFWGKQECKEYGVPTVAVLMKDYKMVAKKVFTEHQRKIRFQKKLHTLFPMIENACFEGMDDEDIQWVGRAIGTVVFDLPARYIGWRSAEYHTSKILADARHEPLKPSVEHIYPRQFCGELLVQHMLLRDGITFDEFAAYANVFRQIAHILSTENHDMKSLQSPDVFVCPEHAYELAGVAMVDLQDGEELLRIEHVTPPEVLEEVFGDRLELLHKYFC